VPPAARPQEAAGQGPPASIDRAAERPPLPLATRSIQRQPAAVETGGSEVAPRGETVQRVVEEAHAEQAGPNLDELARRVYPFVKRLLAVERERLPR